MQQVIGEIYMEQSNFEESLKYFDKAEKIRRDKDLLVHTLIEKANVYIKMKLNDKALQLLEEGLEILHKNNDIEYILKGNYKLIDVYEQTKKIYVSLQQVKNIMRI